jgi:hypothetical protein
MAMLKMPTMLVRFIDLSPHTTIHSLGRRNSSELDQVSYGEGA